MNKPKLNSLPKQIGARINQGRTALEITQAGLAKKAALSRSAVVHYEQGNAVPGSTELVKLAQALNISPNYLLSGSDNFFPSKSSKHALLDENPQLVTVKAAMCLTILDREVQESISALLMSLVKAKLNTRDYQKFLEEAGLMSQILPGLIPRAEKIAEKTLVKRKGAK